MQYAKKLRIYEQNILIFKKLCDMIMLLAKETVECQSEFGGI